ncbi:Putative ATP-binding protein [Mycobacteroides abscessus subsp. abscessus]|nr:Putative ATP-binding protein [Mycobacteroides abscessus subsp. abscessus]
MKQQNLPPEHLFSRRADFLTFGMLGQLHTTANWHRIAREWLYDEDPVTELGRAHRQWLAQRTPPKPARARKKTATRR